MSQVIGYARVSTLEQDPALQEHELRAAGATVVYTDKASGVRADRPQLARALNDLESGDTLVVWRLDRLGRSVLHLLHTVSALGERGVHFRSLRDQIDTSTAFGRLIFHFSAALAEFERDLNRERTLAGLEAARRSGKRPGRRRVMDAKRIATARALLAQGYSQREVARQLHVSRDTIARNVVAGAPEAA